MNELMFFKFTAYTWLEKIQSNRFLNLLTFYLPIYCNNAIHIQLLMHNQLPTFHITNYFFCIYVLNVSETSLNCTFFVDI